MITARYTRLAASSVVLGGVLLNPLVALADESCIGIECLAWTVLDTIDYVLIPLLFAVAFVVFLYGVANAYIFSRGDATKVQAGHRLILWGIIGFFVMLSLWGIVRIVSDSVGLSDYNLRSDLMPTI